MRRRYWLPGGALIGVGLVLRLFFVYLHFAGMFLMGVGAVVLLFGLVDALLPRFVWLRVVRLVMLIGAGLVLVTVVAGLILFALALRDTLRARKRGKNERDEGTA